MDGATIVGFLAGTVLLFWAIISGGGLGMFLNLPSFMITGGGTMAAVLIAFPMKKVLTMVKVASKAFLHKAAGPEATIKDIMDLAVKARRDGMLSLEQAAGQVGDKFLKQAVQLLVDNVPPETIRQVLERETENLEDRHEEGQTMFKSMAAYAPAFGMIGTLIGLVQMLRTLDDPSKIGGGMATALITTFYGAVFANLVCTPMAGKLAMRTREEVRNRRIVIEGVLAIQAGHNPSQIGDTLKAFLPPGGREAIQRKAA